jgi:N-acetyl-anhydromuramyl-L-alanine amidase AmpD
MTVLKRGSEGAEVTELQAKLIALGFNIGIADGRFGPGTEGGLVAFQKKYGLLTDGLAGPVTMSVLEEEYRGPSGLAIRSEGPQVAKLQERLKDLGYKPGLTDTSFGPLTESALIGFQRNNGLLDDGIAGPKTLAALYSADAVPTKASVALRRLKLDRTMRLGPEHYVDVEYHKDLIVLHHTVGGTAMSTFDWWRKEDPPRRAVSPLMIEKTGKIYELFDHNYWAYHLKMPGTRGVHDKRSIGIGIVTEGPLKEFEGRLYCFDRISPRTEFKGDFYDHGSNWRGSRYYDAYSEKQIDALISLIDYLCEVYGIPRRTPADHLSYNPDLREYKGIIGHHHVRADKSDIHPGFDWEALVDGCRLSRTSSFR